MSGIHDKLRKLLALAEQGVGGEKVNAERMLEKLMHKHGLTMDDIESEESKTYWWNYDSKYECMVLQQVYGRVMGVNQISYLRGDRKLGFRLTPTEFLEVDTLYSVYRGALKQHIKRAVEAFIVANDIYANVEPVEREYTAEELEELKRMLRMAEGIEATPVRKQLSKDKS